MTATNAIQVEGLIINYNSFSAVQNLWFAVREGESFSLLGSNGAGQSTTVSKAKRRGRNSCRPRLRTRCAPGALRVLE
jgi:ABC-type uncharacterized transport system ATPase subunit